MKVLVALSGGVDSSVAAAALVADGHHVVGVTMRLWGGESDTGCCSVADVDDARRVAQQLDIDHLVFNFSDDFERHVVSPYVEAHRHGVTPNPCIECNRHLKFARLTERADLLGFDAVATGHHARIVTVDGSRHVARGADAAKDQSYVVHMLGQRDLGRTLFPVGEMTKTEVRARAEALGLRTADKPDSQDVCFIPSAGGRGAGGRAEFLGRRIPLRPARVVDDSGEVVGTVDSVEMVTVGQRRGIGLPGGGPKRYVIGVDHGDGATAPTVVVGDATMLERSEMRIAERVWADRPVHGSVLVQTSAHGTTAGAVLDETVVRWDRPQRVVAPGQSVVFYDASDRYVLGGALAV